MSALIEEIIPEQGFEIVGNKIGTIIFEELSKQKELQPLRITEELNVFSESSVPESITENLTINVLFDSANYGSISEKDAQGKTNFFIDVYTTGVETDGVPGDVDSAKRLHKFLGLCRYILQSSKYKILGFPAGLIGGTYVESIETLPPAQKQDSAFTRFGRITFGVKIQENQKLWEGVLLSQSDSNIKLQLTEQGYKYNYTR